MSILESARQDRVLRVTLNRPEKRNALNVEICRLLAQTLESGAADPTIGAILLTANGTSFCAGMDLDEVASGEIRPVDEAQERLFTIGRRLAKPLIAAVAGPALGGGTGLAANCHVLVAGPSATFGLTEIRLGLWPFLVFRAVSAAIGERRTLELALTGEIFGPERAAQIGLATEVAADPEARAAELAARIAGWSPTAIRNGLHYVRESRGLDSAGAGEIARRLRWEIMRSPEFAESLRAFREKRNRSGG